MKVSDIFISAPGKAILHGEHAVVHGKVKQKYRDGEDAKCLHVGCVFGGHCENETCLDLKSLSHNGTNSTISWNVCTEMTLHVLVSSLLRRWLLL